MGGILTLAKVVAVTLTNPGTVVDKQVGLEVLEVILYTHLRNNRYVHVHRVRWDLQGHAKLL